MSNADAAARARRALARAEDVAESLARLGRGAKLAARTLSPLDPNPVPAEWTHVTKVDPEEAKKLPLLYPLYLRHTSAVSVGGSADVTATNTEQTFELLEAASVPTFHEPSGPTHVTRKSREMAAFLAIPEVLNGDSESLVGQLGAGVEHIREELVPELLAAEWPWLPRPVESRLADFLTSWLLSEAVFEAYIIQNPDSAAAREANVGPDDLLTPREAKHRAMAADRHLESELVYVEYSGTFGGEEAEAILDAVSPNLTWARLWYGGGIDSREAAERMLAAGADAVVVGDAFHRVADEEADLCARATDDLDATATAADVRAWVDDRVEVADSAAAAYLSTIPAVSDPEALAEEYLVATVRTWLGLRELAAESVSVGDATDEADLRRALDAAAPEWFADATDGADDGDAELVRRGVLALLAERGGVEAFDAARTHLGLSRED
ncbi:MULTISPECIES: heptaprenylglyceryl phosphate synthase [Halorussus]|uniref:heptaprenylglyceryl phosphate synthase n=1 Tax=Halorussus TaxID=1070314 RepID=UPI00209D4542|nr:heptaprenylglyceryl phosphate synthase [Halorussus vallis]USZ75788.1 heptaprenylglyceryl phosphate synthase [Halorussus vallis]